MKTVFKLNRTGVNEDARQQMAAVMTAGRRNGSAGGEEDVRED